MPNKNNLSSEIMFELTNGETVPLTLTWGLLMQTRSKSKSDYTRFSKMVTGGISGDVLGSLTILYAAYLCGYIKEHGGTSGCMSEQDFIDLVPDNFRIVIEAAQNLLDPKQAGDSVNPS